MYHYFMAFHKEYSDFQAIYHLEVFELALMNFHMTHFGCWDVI